MSKRILAVTIAVGALAASNAFASRATNLVLGTGEAGVILENSSGSLFYDDNRNIFYNPVYVNDFKNWASIEKSNYPGNTAEGGFITSIMNFNVGLYVNRGGAIIGQKGVAGAGPITYQTAPVRPVEIFAGSDLGMLKWGIGVSHAANFQGVGTASDINVSAGVSVMNFEPFFAIKAQGKDPGPTLAPSDVARGTHNYWRIGARYRWGEWSPFAAYSNSHENVNSGSKENAWGVGIGRSAKIAEGVKLNYAISYWRAKDTIADSPVEPKRQIIPIEFSAEGDATQWLTLRGGVGYRIFDRTDTISATDATTGRLGATVHAGKADFDFAVGKTTGGTETATATDSQNFDFSNGLFTAASFTYHW